MKKTKVKNFLKTGIKICQIMLLLFSSRSFAARWAVVKNTKAIVYSDVKMSSEIGYISKGKKVRVGDVPKNNERVLPILLKNRVGYIRIRDLSLGNDMEKLRGVTDRYQERIKNSARDKSTLGAYLGGLFPSFRSEGADELGVNGAFIGGGLSAYYKNPNLKWKGKLSLEYLQYTSGEEKMNFFSIPVGMMFYTKVEEKLKYEFYYGLILHPFIEFRRGNDIILNGQGLGGFISMEIQYELSNRSNISFIPMLEVNKLSNFGTDSNSEVAKFLGNSLNGYLYGPKFFVQYSFDF